MSLLQTLKSLLGLSATPGSTTSDLTSLEAIRRPCWLPVTGEGDGDVAASKFSGIPYLLPDEDWPKCPNCGKPTQLFVQLNSDDLPVECGKLWGDGLLQFFYCTSFEPPCDVTLLGWEPFSRNTLVRVITAGKEGPVYKSNPVEDAFPAKRIVGWTRSDDMPDWTELGEFGIDVSDEKLNEMMETYPREGEKLLGWPHWVQGAEYPDCPQCGARMRLVFQVDSNHNLPHDFGDVGVGHITQCPTHVDQLAFGWACY